MDWHSHDVRLSADLGWQENRLKATRTNVLLSSDVSEIPRAPAVNHNFAQPWTYSNERTLFSTLRGEWDISPDMTAWGAYGMRRGEEGNSLSNLTVTDAHTGAGSMYRFDNERRDAIDTAEVGLRGRFAQASWAHHWVASASIFRKAEDSAYAFDYAQTYDTDLYNPIDYARPDWSRSALFAGDLDHPLTTRKMRLHSMAVGDTLALWEDRVRLSVGLRHQRYDVQSRDYTTGQTLSRYTQSRISPAVGAVWRLHPWLSFYGNYVEGLSQGGIAPSTAANAGEQLAPYLSRQKELGLKYQKGALGASLAVFSTSRPHAYVGADNFFTAKGQDRHRGIELSAYGRVVPGICVLGGVTLLESSLQASQRQERIDGLSL